MSGLPYEHSRYNRKLRLPGVVPTVANLINNLLSSL